MTRVFHKQALRLIVLLALLSFSIAPFATAQAVHNVTTWDGWTKSIGGLVYGEGAYAREMKTDSLGNVYIVGTFDGTIDFDPTASEDIVTSLGNDSYMTKYSSSGTYLWTRTWESTVNISTDGLLIFPDDTIALKLGVYIGEYPHTGSIDFDPTVGEDIHSYDGQGEDISSGTLVLIQGDGSYIGTRDVLSDSYVKVQSDGDAVGIDLGGEAHIFKVNGTLETFSSHENIEYDQVVIDNDDNIHIIASYVCDVELDPNLLQVESSCPLDSNGKYPDANAVMLNYDAEGTFLSVSNLGLRLGGQTAYFNPNNSGAGIGIRSSEVDTNNNFYVSGWSRGAIGLVSSPGAPPTSPEVDGDGNYVLGPYDHSDGSDYQAFLMRINSDGSSGPLLIVDEPSFQMGAGARFDMNSQNELTVLLQDGVTKLDTNLQTISQVAWNESSAAYITFGPNDEMYTVAHPRMDQYNPDEFTNPYTEEEIIPSTSLTFTRWGTPVTEVVQDPVYIYSSLYPITNQNLYATGDAIQLEYTINHSAPGLDEIDTYNFEFDTENIDITSIEVVDSPSYTSGVYNSSNNTWVGESSAYGTIKLLINAIALNTSASDATGSLTARIASGTYNDVSVVPADVSTLEANYGPITIHDENYVGFSTDSNETATVGSPLRTVFELEYYTSTNHPLSQIEFSLETDKVDITNVTVTQDSFSITSSFGTYNEQTNIWTGALPPDNSLYLIVDGTVPDLLVPDGFEGGYTVTANVDSLEVAGVVLADSDGGGTRTASATGTIYPHETDVSLIGELHGSTTTSTDAHLTYTNLGTYPTFMTESMPLTILLILPPGISYESSDNMTMMATYPIANGVPAYGAFFPEHTAIVLGYMPSQPTALNINDPFGSIVNLSIDSSVTTTKNIYALVAGHFPEADLPALMDAFTTGEDYRLLNTNNAITMAYIPPDSVTPTTEQTTVPSHSTATTSPPTTLPNSPTTATTAAKALAPGTLSNLPSFGLPIPSKIQAEQALKDRVEVKPSRATRQPVLRDISPSKNNVIDTILLLLVALAIIALTQRQKIKDLINRRKQLVSSWTPPRKW